MRKTFYLCSILLLFLGCNYSGGFIVFPALPSWLKISTYGLMMACGFLAANFLIQKEFQRLKISSKLGDNLVITAVIGGIIGAKIFFVWETSADWSGLKGLTDRLFSGGGLTWYGGFIVAAVALFVIIRRSGYSFLRMGDIITPILAMGYGFGRLGCLFSGDGCYGVACPYKWPAPFAMAFPNGAAPWSEIVSRYGDPSVVVYNTPLFEATLSYAMFIGFWLIRKKDWPLGIKFATFAIIHSLFRFFIEFIRLNPKDVFGMTQGQFVSLIIIAVALGYFFVMRKDLSKFVKDGFKWTYSSDAKE